MDLACESIWSTDLKPGNVSDFSSLGQTLINCKYLRARLHGPHLKLSLVWFGLVWFLLEAEIWNKSTLQEIRKS